MSFAIVISPKAQKDLQEICIYYENISPNLKQIFLDSIDIRLKKLSTTPFAASIRYENIRCTLVKKFPYLIHYYVNEKNKNVVVIRLFSTHQKPIWTTL